jgi:nucleoside 2-deoxyribosyltransferase
MSDNCCLCNGSCTRSQDNDYYYYQCPNCGNFKVEFTLVRTKLADPETKFKAACVAVERKIRNQDNYVILEQENKSVKGKPAISIDRLLSAYPESPTELLNKVLLNLNAMIDHPGDKIILEDSNPFVLYSQNSDQMKNVLTLLKEIGYIQESSANQILILPKGWEIIQELQKTLAIDSNQVFVAMWFDDSRLDIYEQGIHPAIEEDCKLKPVRIDLVEHNEDIVVEILEEIKKSRFVVADFTGGRQGVYFEAGFARGLGIPVIWLVQKDHKDDLHFDTQHFNHIFYEGPEDLRKKLANRIKATVL